MLMACAGLTVVVVTLTVKLAEVNHLKMQHQQGWDDEEEQVLLSQILLEQCP